MKVLLKLFRGPIKKILIRQIEKEEIRKTIVDFANKKVDIPNLNEKEEAALIDGILASCAKAIVIALDRL